MSNLPALSTHDNSRLMPRRQTTVMAALIFGGWILLTSFIAHANHQRSEPSDGTVKSFRAVTQAKTVLPVTFFDQDIQPVNLQMYRGKVVLINIWASWCGPCRRELPALDRLQAKFDKNEFVILPISIDHQPAQLTQQFTQQLALEHLNFYHDIGRQMGRIFPVDVVPANFILDRHGRVISFLRSYVDWDDQLASNMVAFYLQQSSEETTLWHPPQNILSSIKPASHQSEPEKHIAK